MILTALALALSPDNTSALKRMEAFFATHPSFEAKLKFSTWKGDHAEGTLLESRPSRVGYKITFPNNTYQFLRTPAGGIETVSGAKVYAEYLSNDKIAFPRTEVTLSEWRLAMPVPLFYNDLNEYFPPDTKISSVAGPKIGGVPTDTVTMKINRKNWKYTGVLSIDPSGRLVRYVTQDPLNAKAFVAVDVTDYSFKPIPPENFKLAILPKGYTLLELPDVPEPLGLDQKLPSGKVVNSSSGEQNGLASLVGSNALLAVVDPVWLASKNGKRALSDIQKVLTEEKAGKITLLSADPGKPSAKISGLNYDPSGKILNLLELPGAPTFFLIGKKGLIERTWCGYSPSNRQFLPELKAAIAHPEESRPD